MCVRGKDEILVSTPNHKAVIFFNTNGLWSDRRRNSSFIGRRDCAEKLIFRAEEDTQYNRSWRSTFIKRASPGIRVSRFGCKEFARCESHETRSSDVGKHENT